MWYAQKSKQKTQEREEREKMVVTLDKEHEREISRLLRDFKHEDSIRPQPSQSYADPNHQIPASKASKGHPKTGFISFDSPKPKHIRWVSEIKKESAGASNGDAVDKFYKDMDDYQEEAYEELYKREEGESDFIAEFNSHNEANRRSQESLPDMMAFQGIQRVKSLDQSLLDDHHHKLTNDQTFREMQDIRRKLPSYKMQKDIVRVVQENQVTVISGETGCGKTTQVAQFILDDFITRGMGSMCRVVCTQPRRISAISVAERVAEERNERCGKENSVGYQIRLESQLPRKKGSILYCTTGIMLKWLLSDNYLQDTSHIILDEVHERDLLCDFLMVILKDLLVQRPDLKLVLMSATLNAEQFSEYFGNAPMMNIPGFTYPVKEYLLEDVIQMLTYHPSEFHIKRKPQQKRLYGKKRYEQMEEQMREEEEMEQFLATLSAKGYSSDTLETLRNVDNTRIDLDLVAELIRHISMQGDEGAILVFVPGWEEIKTLKQILDKDGMFSPDMFRIIPLHSLMPTINQKQVFQRPPPGVRKIVIATNIAETSITIDDVVHVIDTGKIKMKDFNPEKNIATLLPRWVSRANARQRRGRAGRVQPGVCYHLYTGLDESKFDDYQLPEILRTRLEELCLQIKLLKLGKIEPFIRKAMQVPSMEALHVSIQLLEDINALDDNEDLTPLGYHLAKMPVDPQTGKMILYGALFGCLDPILTIAASLSFKDAFYIPMEEQKKADQQRQELADGCRSDHIMLARAFSGWEEAKQRGTDRHYCYNYFLSANTLKMLSDMKRQFADLLLELGFLSNRNAKHPSVNANSGNDELIRAVLCAGLYPNVAKLRKLGKGGRPTVLSTKTERKVCIHPKSVNANEKEFESRWFIFHLKMKTTNVYLYDLSETSPFPLLFFGGMISSDVGKQSAQSLVPVSVDEWIDFNASPATAKIVKELRYEFDALLEYKITHPCVTDWNPRSKEGALMRAIISLITTEMKITTEEHKQMTQNYDDD
ncbi:unnamed protein product [Owenia fusiformis]|uniref:ATP-dependent DNA/RNA helicase DHX36 n=1 Tax=Owenia fusiformis TaxID=6347 RepID=A0A8S4N1U2_OWEFU|nr:unnamed protein product [Owenia fusiformis]